jgi:hypothetical protein
MIGVMLGIAKSSLHVPIQLLSFCFAMVGFFFAKLYGHSTPHLYAGNSHHTMGWVLFLFLIVQMAVGVVRKIANAVGKRTNATYEQIQQREQLLPSSSSAPSSSSSASSDHHSEASGDTLHMHDFEFDKHEPRESLEEEDMPSLRPQQQSKDGVVMRMFNVVSPYIPNLVKNAFVTVAYNPFTTVVCRYYHLVMGRTFVVLIFVQTLSGLVVYHGVCR